MSAQDPRTFPVVLTRDEAGFVNASCPVLPDCFSQGRTRDEALANMREAIELTLESRTSEDGELSLDYEVAEIRVA